MARSPRGNPIATGNALSELIGEGPEIDLGGMITQMMGSGLDDAAKSWLGDGTNQPVSAQQIIDGIGLEQIAGFAKQLGLNQDDAAGALAGMLPDLMNQSSTGGNVLDTVGGLAAKLFT